MKVTSFVLVAAGVSFGALSFSTLAMAAPLVRPVLADVSLLNQAGVKILSTESSTGVGYAQITLEEEARLSKLAHETGRCGGYEALAIPTSIEPMNPVMTHVFGQLKEQTAKNLRFRFLSNETHSLVVRPEIEAALKDVSDANIRESVVFLAAYPSRAHNGSDPNRHVEAVKARLETLLKNSSVPYKIDLISHQSTEQKSVRVSITGAQRPSEIVVLGGHLDSINQEWFGGDTAPGADDNASGSADLFEALRVLISRGQPERTVEFFWYAGEEGGLLGSAEIARDYKKQNKDVIGVLQLDMTMFPGDGEFVLGSMNDFTSAWMRGYMEELNALYIHAKIIEDKCGYGCSDHASWFRQGYPTVMPFEASFKGMNHNLHTSRDKIDGTSNFRHSAMFSKLALTVALDLSNSSAREPK